MQAFWDNRYSLDGYVYGEKPNIFFAQELEGLTPGKVLLPGEGEGRNAVHAARQGWKVWAFDFSNNAHDKALKLAHHHSVSINYQIISYADYVPAIAMFDCLALIYAHVTDGNRQLYHRKMLESLKPGGKLILEAFSKSQIKNKTGGPQNIDFLYSKEELAEDFNELQQLRIDYYQLELNEGECHQGKADVIRLTGIR